MIQHSESKNFHVKAEDKQHLPRDILFQNFWRVCTAHAVFKSCFCVHAVTGTGLCPTSSASALVCCFFRDGHDPHHIHPRASIITRVQRNSGILNMISLFVQSKLSEEIDCLRTDHEANSIDRHTRFCDVGCQNAFSSAVVDIQCHMLPIGLQSRV